MLIRIGLGLAAYPRTSKRVNPTTLTGISFNRASSVARLAPNTLAAVSIGRGSSVAKLSTMLVGSSTGRSSSVANLTSATVGFDPASVAGLQAWYDASSLGLADLAPVASLTDKSSFLRHATQATAAAQPVQRTAIQNGLSVVRFDGVDDFLRSGIGFTLAQPSTIILVLKVIAGDATNPYLLDSANSPNRQFIRRNSTKYVMSGGLTLSPTGTSVAAADVVTAIYNGVNSFEFLNGTQIVTGDAGALGMNGVGLGVSATNTGYSNIDFMECVIYSGALGTTDRQYLERGFGTKWGITVA